MVFALPFSLTLPPHRPALADAGQTRTAPDTSASTPPGAPAPTGGTFAGNDTECSRVHG